MSFYAADPERRENTIKGLRDLADFLDANPDVPAPSVLDIQVSTHRAEPMSQQMASVDEFAVMLNRNAGWMNDEKTHYWSMRHFGPVRFFAVAVAIDRDGGDE